MKKKKLVKVKIVFIGSHEECYICGTTQKLEDIRCGGPPVGGWKYYKLCRRCSKKAILDGYDYYEEMRKKNYKKRTLQKK